MNLPGTQSPRSSTRWTGSTGDANGNRLVRIHAVGFPVQFIRAPHLQTTGIRFATLMRELTFRNGGTFVALNDFRPDSGALQRLLAASPAGAAGGCGPAKVVVEGKFPPPLMEPLPLTMGVWYGEDFATHEFFDEAKSRERIQLDRQDRRGPGADVGHPAGRHVRHCRAYEGTAGRRQMNQAVDAVLIPHVEELQYAIPAHTNVKVYEIWMRYRFELVTTGGDPIAEWTMSSYGKTPTAFLRSDKEAVNLAAVMALRDAGANFRHQLHPGARGAGVAAASTRGSRRRRRHDRVATHRLLWPASP